MKAYFYNKKTERIYIADNKLYIKNDRNVEKIGLCRDKIPNGMELQKRLNKRKKELSLVNITLSQDIIPF